MIHIWTIGISSDLISTEIATIKILIYEWEEKKDTGVYLEKDRCVAPRALGHTGKKIRSAERETVLMDGRRCIDQRADSKSQLSDLQAGDPAPKQSSTML